MEVRTSQTSPLPFSMGPHLLPSPSFLLLFSSSNFLFFKQNRCQILLPWGSTTVACPEWTCFAVSSSRWCHLTHAALYLCPYCIFVSVHYVTHTHTFTLCCHSSFLSLCLKNIERIPWLLKWLKNQYLNLLHNQHKPLQVGQKTLILGIIN